MSKNKESNKKSIVNDFLSNTKVKDLDLAATLNESKLSNISEYISTGSYSLNKIVSGSYFKGLPSGRIMAFAGPSGCGKSYICGNCMREAQKAGRVCIVFDTENAVDKEFLGRIGVDVDEVLHIPVNTVGELILKGTQIMRDWHEQYPDQKLFIVVDSIGGLMTNKEYVDEIEANKSAADMGLRAKELRKMAKIFTHEVAKYDACMAVTNHTYESPQQNPMAAPIIKMQGGEGFVYATSGIIYLRKKIEKEERKKVVGSGNEKVVTGCILNCSTEKNRLVPQGLKGQIYLSFQKGTNRWYGMLEDAVSFGFIEQKGAWYTILDPDSNETIKKVQKKDLYKSDVWKPILEKLNAKVEATYRFSEFIDEDEVDDTLNDLSDDE